MRERGQGGWWLRNGKVGTGVTVIDGEGCLDSISICLLV